MLAVWVSVGSVGCPLMLLNQTVDLFAMLLVVGQRFLNRWEVQVRKGIADALEIPIEVPLNNDGANRNPSSLYGRLASAHPWVANYAAWGSGSGRAWHAWYSGIIGCHPSEV